MSNTAVLSRETAVLHREDESIHATVAVSSARASRSITSALAFLIGCIILLMTGFAIIMPVFPQRLHALGLGADENKMAKVPGQVEMVSLSELNYCQGI